MAIHRKTLVVLALLPLVACAENFTLPEVSATYRVEETGAPSWTPAEQALADQINERLVKEGFPRAEPGSYETSLAALNVSMLRSKRWSTANRRDNQRLALDTDEAEGTEYPKTHLYHRLLARGVAVPWHLWSGLYVDDFPKRKLWNADLDKMWAWIRPSERPHATLRIGVAVLSDGVDGKRYFGVVLRDDRIDLTQGPPRTAEPGSTFTMRGQVHGDEMKPLKLAVERPDGTIEEGIIDQAADGSFEMSYQLPKTPGRYLVSIGPGWSAVTVPVFAGAPPAPWPTMASPEAVDPQTARDAIKELAKAFYDWRKGQNLPVASLPADLCAFSKLEAKRGADEAAAPMTAERAHKDEKLRLRAAGLDPTQVTIWRGRAVLSESDQNNLLHGWENVIAAIPWNPFDEASLRLAKQLAIGAVPEPKQHDDDPQFIDFVWMSLTAEPAPSASR